MAKKQTFGDKANSKKNAKDMIKVIKRAVLWKLADIIAAEQTAKRAVRSTILVDIIICFLLWILKTIRKD